MKLCISIGVGMALLLSGCATTNSDLIARQQALIERQQKTIGELLSTEQTMLSVEQKKMQLMMSIIAGPRPNYESVPLHVETP